MKKTKLLLIVSINILEIGVLYIIRGLPGTGKTTLASRMVQYGMIDCFYETDQWFMQGQKYVFVPELLQQNHQLCYEAVKKHLESGGRCAVSNTFTRIWEFERYATYCDDIGCPYTIITCEGIHGNHHGVSEQHIERMKDRWQNYA